MGYINRVCCTPPPPPPVYTYIYDYLDFSLLYNEVHFREQFFFSLSSALLSGHCHAKNKFAGRIIPFSVLGFWDKNTGVCAGAMPYRRDFTATTRI